MLKKMMLLPLVGLLALPLSAQSQNTEADSVYEFRFVPKKNAFFIPYKDNLPEMRRLSSFVEQHRYEIADGTLPLRVDGYCSSLSGTKANLATARLRSNRVKSELILRNGLRESNFITHNHAEGGDLVTVRVVFPAAPKAEPQQPAAQPKAENTPAEAEPEVAENEQPAAAPAVSEERATKPYALALRANLLRWATLTPDLGLEWRINRNVGVLVNASWTSWSWDNKNRRYALWRVSPEVRYYIGVEKRGYLGAMYHVGEFNYKFSATGRQGNLQGGGITGGWQLPLGRALALDFHAALGYTRAEYDKYSVIDGVRVRQGCDTKNYWGINQLGITLMWKFMK